MDGAHSRIILRLSGLGAVESDCMSSGQDALGGEENSDQCNGSHFLVVAYGTYVPSNGGPSAMTAEELELAKERAFEEIELVRTSDTRYMWLLVRCCKRYSWQLWARWRPLMMQSVQAAKALQSTCDPP